MQYYWLNKKGNKDLIIFFCGWSFDYKPFESLDCESSDVLVIYDYTDMAKIIDEIKSFEDFSKYFSIDKNYESYELITWSMGVFAAYLLRKAMPKFSVKIAINGTPYPIHEDWGIPAKTFDLTLKFVDSGLQGKFQKNLFKRANEYEKYLTNPVKRTIENQKNELIALDRFIKARECEYEKFYDYAIISDTDKIVPTRNQLNLWQEKAEVVVVNSGHFPFYGFNSWKEIIECKQTLKQ